MSNNVINQQVYLNHKEKNYFLELPSAILFEFKNEARAREFNEGVWMLLCSQGFPDMRSSLVDMEASEIYTKQIAFD